MIPIEFLHTKVEKDGDCLLLKNRYRTFKYKGEGYTFNKAFALHYNLKSDGTYKPICGKYSCTAQDHMRWRDMQTICKKERLELIQKQAQIIDECLVYPCQLHNGYGKIHIRGKSQYLHRVIYWLGSDFNELEDLPKDLQIAHLCRNITCVNPDHYSLATTYEQYDHKIRDNTTLVGSRHHRTDLSLKQAQEIADSWSTGQTVLQRAQSFGVSRSVVHHIDSRTTWSEVSHPNGKEYVSGIEKQRQRLARGKAKQDFTQAELTQIKIALREKSESIDSVLPTQCHRWKTKYIDRPMMGMFCSNRIAARWACIVSTGKDMKDLQARHLCGKEWCVNPDHVVWGTAMENTLDKLKHGTYGGKLSVDQVREMRSLADHSIVDLAKKYNVTENTIRDIKTKRTWKNLH